MKNLQFRKLTIMIVIFITAAFIGGYVVRSFQEDGAAVTEDSSTVQEQQFWTCSMHPWIRESKPGKCRICFMDLIPLEGHSSEAAKRQVSFSQEALKLMEIETTAVERKFVEAEIRMTGKIDFDETRVKNITAWVPGRINRLYVDFTGTRVIKGDHMVSIYSPELISAQAEFIEASKAVKNINSGSSDFVRRSTEATLEAAREKLRLLGLAKEQIEQIEITGQPADYITIYAPIEGIVIEKHATEGMYVQTGTKIYTIADLSELWVQLDAYESDVRWVKYGQEVEFGAEALPGEVFKGVITFISPTLDSRTRTIKLRANVSNPEGKLKPGMFVRAVIRSKVAGEGMIMDADMAGKWVCPMHPSVIKDSFGKCDICQMDLVTTESRGYVTAGESEEKPLVIPASAALVTGKRAVVYVRLPDPNTPTFEGREVVLGPRAGDYYLVEEGLEEEELVVTKGSFKIDADLQIQAKPSMMNPEGSGVVEHHHTH